MTGNHSPDLDAARRTRELTDLAESTVDLLVVGAGITGVGVALDAASRGLSVAVIEKADLANGTSRWSSKLVHGGLRYLAHGDIGLAVESARERHALMTTIAPHLVRPLPMLLPANLPTRLGVGLGDVIRRAVGTRTALLPWARGVDPEEASRLVPAMRPRRGLLHWDGQVVDDARLVTAVARTAASHGAAILTRVRATALRGTGADVVDEVTGESATIVARAVVNATGVWAGTLAPEVALSPSRGAHIVLRSAALGHPHAALNVLVPGSRSRWVFALPTDDDMVLVGLTDDPYDGPTDSPPVTDADEEFLLSTLSSALRTPLGPGDVVGRFAGLRPLLSGGGATADLSRHHAVVRGGDGVVTITGGKLTTYRKMAADAVDATALTAVPSATRRLPLVGAGSPAQLQQAAARWPARLVRRYGTEAGRVVQSTDRGDEPLISGRPELRGEVAFGLRCELALDAGDLLDRRTRLGLVPADRERAAPVVDELIAAHAARQPGPVGGSS
ncbi:MAG: glycerol-3-phosphate dehydrogenase [Frankiaceae bacterium]|nr:glycerol-3-phosphate dehydrogenase [Frankiaceae bacterium]